MNFPKVSVIIPNYNHGRHLKQRIDSVLDQTFKNFEVIILDDCSLDNSREIIKNYENHPFVKHIVFNDHNTGNPFKQWQQGVNLAIGEWIWFAESDDYADVRFLEVMTSVIADQPDIGLLYCDSCIVSNNVVQPTTFAALKNKRFNTDRWSENYTNNGKDEIENYLLSGGTINNSSAVLFNHGAFKEANPFDISFRYIGDKYTFVKVLAKRDVAYVKDSLNYYRDPFNVKHSDKFLFYFYEQFLVFNWVYRNLAVSDKRKLNETFYKSTTFSMYTNWSKAKLVILKNLFFVNAWLFIKCMVYNLKRPSLINFR